LSSSGRNTSLFLQSAPVQQFNIISQPAILNQYLSYCNLSHGFCLTSAFSVPPQVKLGQLSHVLKKPLKTAGVVLYTGVMQPVNSAKALKATSH